jgi:hypothetical protein
MGGIIRHLEWVLLQAHWRALEYNIWRTQSDAMIALWSKGKS